MYTSSLSRFERSPLESSCRTSPIKTLYSKKETGKYETTTRSGRPSLAADEGEQKLRNAIYRLPRNGRMTPSSFHSSLNSSSRLLDVENSRYVEKLLPPQREIDKNKKTLVVDLDETLVHSCFTKPRVPVELVVPVYLDGQTYEVFIHKRPGVDQFLRRLSPFYEIVIFTASLKNYADPLLDRLDRFGYCSYRLYRQHCVLHDGVYVKDLARIGRDLKEVIIIDNADFSYLFQPNNALPCSSWYEDKHDTELLDMIPILQALGSVRDVTEFIPNIVAHGSVLFGEAVEKIRLQKRKYLEDQVSQVIARATEETNRISNFLPLQIEKYKTPERVNTYSYYSNQPLERGYQSQSPFKKKASMATDVLGENSLSQTMIARQLDAYTARTFGDRDIEDEYFRTPSKQAQLNFYPRRSNNITPEPKPEPYLEMPLPYRKQSSSTILRKKGAYQFPPSPPTNYLKKSETQVHSPKRFTPMKHFHTRFPSMTEGRDSKLSSRTTTPRGQKQPRDFFNQTISAGGSNYMSRDSLNNTLHYQEQRDHARTIEPSKNKTPAHRLKLKNSYHLLTEQIKEAKRALFGLTLEEDSKRQLVSRKLKNGNYDPAPYKKKSSKVQNRQYQRGPEFPAQSHPPPPLNPANVAGKREAIRYSPRPLEDQNMKRESSMKKIKRSDKYHHQPRQLADYAKHYNSHGASPENRSPFKDPYELSGGRYIPTFQENYLSETSMADLKRNQSNPRLSRNYSESRGAILSSSSQQRLMLGTQPKQALVSKSENESKLAFSQTTQLPRRSNGTSSQAWRRKGQMRML